MTSPELQSRIQQLRYRIASGEKPTIEEMKEAIAAVRGTRMTAATSSDTARRAKAKAAIPNADDLIAELGGLP